MLGHLSTPSRWSVAVAWAVFVWLSLTFSPTSSGDPGWLDRLLLRLAPLAEGTGGDKLVHAVLFAVLALLVLRAVRAAGPIPRATRLLVVLAVALYGGATELAQATSPARTASWGDLVADVAGAVFVGWLVGRGGSIPTPSATRTRYPS